MLLYDVSSSDVEGSCCPLAQFGDHRDGKKGKRQIVYGLLCASDGCPIAVEMFTGNTADPTTLATQVNKIRDRFGLTQVALVGDRGMITTRRIREDLKPAMIDWIAALTTTDIRKLLKPTKTHVAPLKPAELVPDAVAEMTHDTFPGERLMVCFNPRLQQERARKREDLLVATEQVLEKIAASVRSGHRTGAAAINQAVGRDINRRKVGKHVDVTVTDTALTWQRREERIAAEAHLDGVYVVRTSLDAKTITAHATVAAYQNLATVERTFRNAKSDLNIRPLYMYKADRVRAHVFLCMLALYLEWHMRRALAPMLFQDDDPDGAKATRKTPVEPAQPSDVAKRKAATKRCADGLPTHSFRTLLADLATVTLNEMHVKDKPECVLPIVTQLSDVQQKAFNLLTIKPNHFVPMNKTG